MTTTGTETFGARAPSRRERIGQWLDAPEDARGLAVFRVLFGALMVFAVIRFAAMGWIRELYVEPSFHFTYVGFGWVKPWPLWGMYLHFACMGLAAISLMLGFFTRTSAFLFCLLFSYAELIEQSAYLNHYYLVSLLGLLLAFVPAGASWSLDAERGGPTSVPRWCYWLFRIQMALVYSYAGIAKLNADWLWRAEPLGLWLGTFSDTPWIGPVFETRWLAFGMSWAGALYDLSVAPLLLWRRTRGIAFAVASVFHVSVWLLFPIGIFPWVMLLGATLFFSPSWPGRWLAKVRGAEVTSASEGLGNLARRAATPAWLLLLASVYLVLQCLVPLRFLLYPGAVNWTEEGFRFAWRVMLVEKAGQVEYEVVLPEKRERFREYPRRNLSKFQYRMLSTQPEMIHAYAEHLAAKYQAERRTLVQVYAHAWVSLNGRRAQRLIDPSVDLASEPRTFGPSRFIVPFEGR